MAKIKVRKQIDIGRNPVERILMKIMDFLKENQKVTIYILGGIFLSAVVAIAVAVIFEVRGEKQRIFYEEIMDNYYKNRNDRKVIEKSIADLKKLSDNAWFGFTSEMPYYVMGNLYFELKKYPEARKNLLKFAGMTSSDMFAPLAYLKAALASEEEGKLDRALAALKKLEKEDPEGLIADQVLYNTGRILIMKGNVAEGKAYLRKVMALFPRSPLVRKAKQRIILAERKQVP